MASVFLPRLEFAGVVFGLAAQPVLSNLIAGVQLAITQPIRIEDAVTVQNEYGWIEEITATYVVIRLWDLRRLIVPLNFFIQQPFYNWTREAAATMGSVLLYLDYAAPVDVVRKKAADLVAETNKDNAKVVSVQVTNTSAEAIEVRILVKLKFRRHYRRRVRRPAGKADRVPAAAASGSAAAAAQRDHRPFGAQGRVDLRLRVRFDGGAGYHHRCGRKCPADCSMTAPTANKVSSSNGRPITCKPKGSPCASRPLGTEMPGRPAIFTVTVNMSFRYISTGSALPFHLWRRRPKASSASGWRRRRRQSTLRNHA